MDSVNRRSALKFAGLLAALGFCIPILSAKGETLKYRLGKQPARPHVGLKLSDYITPHKLPPPPEEFGHESLIPNWGMLGNDQVGDCAIAGPFHALMLWNAEGKKPIHVDTPCTLRAYSAITGYDPTNPSTDQGSNVQEVSEYWRTKGLRDAKGKVHRIDAFLALEPKNIEQLWQALYLFDGVGIGIDCPEEYQEAFANGQVWDELSDPHIAGGHYILGVGKRNGMINVVTWGRTQLMTAAGYEQFNDETFIYLDEEKLINGKDIDGFDLAQLVADMADLAGELTEPFPVCGES